MTCDMTRRRFGMMTFGTLAAFAGGQLKAANGYANSHLLVDPNELIAKAGTGSSGRPIYEQDDMIVIDVRELEAYQAGHVPGARHLDPNAVVARHSPVSGSLKSTEELSQLLGELGISADRRVVFYDDRGGFHAARMFWLLEYLGHRNVALLNGGYSAWVEAGGTVAKDPIPHEARVFQAAPSPRRYASAQDVLAYRGDPSAILVDVRPPKIFAEGHIPWAVNIAWADNLDADGTFLSADALQAHFTSNGVTHDKHVIMHCQVGLASSHSYVALRLLGYNRVRVYHRSWAEWGADPSLPST